MQRKQESAYATLEKKNPKPVDVRERQTCEMEDEGQRQRLKEQQSCG